MEGSWNDGNRRVVRLGFWNLLFAARGERELGFLTLSESHFGPCYLGLRVWVCCRFRLGLGLKVIWVKVVTGIG
ncbi:hypothetical protein F383_23024 [Gossypium arboreum]|uniref:Uncharacterized protein n=1 Tax=Gossypium arboreum TaxID=29729 RepID=A0A0B0P315_GOSAR|nr:hypothetical protein F383_23024 [Gossypium arboreum]